MASLPSRTDALVSEFFLCQQLYQTFIVEVELPAMLPWVGTSYIHANHTFLRSRCGCAGPICVLEQVVGVEPTPSAWKAEVLAAIRYLHFIAFLAFLTYILY